MQRERIRWEVAPTANPVARWVVTYNGKIRAGFMFKYSAMAYAVRTAQAYLAHFGEPSELIVKGKDGTFKDRRTYGADRGLYRD